MRWQPWPQPQSVVIPVGWDCNALHWRKAVAQTIALHMNNLPCKEVGVMPRQQQLCSSSSFGVGWLLHLQQHWGRKIAQPADGSKEWWSS